MWLNTLWQRWHGRSRPLPSFLTGQRTIRKSSHRVRMVLEALEDRTVPSTFTVNSIGDTGAGSGTSGDLRYCITQANLGGNNSIQFDPTVFATPQTITLSGTQLELSDTTGTMTIQGPTAGVTISGGGLSRIFQIDKLVTASISGLTMSGGNSGSYSKGGGLANFGTTTLADCTVSGNSAKFFSYGGGLFNGGTLTMVNCTVSGNSVAGDGGGVASGTFANSSPTLTMTNCTVSANSAYYGGGLLATGTATLTNAIVAGNSGNDIYAPSASGTNNLIGIGFAGGLTNGVNGNLVGVANPLLAALGNYGGPTQTMALLPGSQAIDAGTSAGAPTTDQRGEARVGAVDIGAFESQGFTMAVVPGSTPQTSNIGTPFANPLAVIVTANNPLEPVDGGVVTFVGHPAANGATAVFLSGTSAFVASTATSAVIAGGQAAVTATPNNADGSYQVTASASGSSSVAFNLTNTGPVFAHLIVNTTSASLFPGAGLLSLPEAVLFADFDRSGNASITFDKNVFKNPQTITLTGAQLELSNTSEAETITGSTAGVTVSGGGLSRVFQVDGGVTASISGLTITGGRKVIRGGGLYNLGGTATLTNCTVSGNFANLGGGVLGFRSATTTLTNCTVTDNSAFVGGGVFGFIGSTTTLTNCSVSGNSARSQGGGMLEDGGTATLTNCTLSGNSASLGAGMDSISSTTTLTNCTISGNSASNIFLGGGGVRVTGQGTTTLSNCSVTGNSSSYGGGLYIGFDGKAALNNCTVSGNTATGGGGGVFDWLFGNSTLTNCTISGNSASGTGVNGSNGGGGLYNGVNSSATLINCTVSGNTAIGPGGGVMNTISSTATLTNCTISGNSASGASILGAVGDGGGVFNGGAGTNQATLTNCNVRNNSAIAGGGIANQGTLTVASSNILNNTATTKGGGISITGGSATITNSVINTNQVNSVGTALGGGIDCENSVLSLAGCTINANQANGTTALGGGIYAVDSTVDIANSVVNGNQANGSVLGEGGGVYSSNSALTLMQSIVKGNKATTAYNDIFGP